MYHNAPKALSPKGFIHAYGKIGDLTGIDMHKANGLGLKRVDMHVDRHNMSDTVLKALSSERFDSCAYTNRYTCVVPRHTTPNVWHSKGCNALAVRVVKLSTLTEFCHYFHW